MKKATLFMSVMLAASLAFAQDNKDKSWFETTLKGLKSKIAQKYQSTSVGASSVAAVRGAKVSDDSTKPYWRGTNADKSGKKLAAQRKQFSAALELALAGKDEAAVKALEKFVKDNPQSPYLADAKEALNRLSGVPAKPEAAAKELSTSETEQAKLTVEQAKPAAVEQAKPAQTEQVKPAVEQAKPAPVAQPAAPEKATDNTVAPKTESK